MRIRSIKPSFWSDAHIADLTEAARLFYIGLWMEADDAGWLRWDTREIAHDLYGFDPVRSREVKVERLLAQLVSQGRVVQHDCGHVQVPTMAKHQHLAGTTRQVRTVYTEHLERCTPASPREVPPLPAHPRPVEVRRGKDSEGLGGDGGVTDFDLKMAAHGSRVH